MKKILCLLLCLTVAAVPLSGCGADNTANNVSSESSVEQTQSESSEQSQQSSDTPSEQNDAEELVEVRIPASLYEGQELTEEQLQQNVEEGGYESYTLNDDGSVTYTMTNARHQQMLDEYKQSVDETIEECIADEDDVYSISNVEYNDDLTQFDIYVDAASYSLADSMSAFAFYLLGGYYQVFSGISADDIDITVNFVDQDTEEVLDTGSYQEFMNRNSDTSSAT